MGQRGDFREPLYLSLRSLFLCGLFLCGSCAYRVGFVQNPLPGGYTQTSIPLFKNKTQHVGAEAFFTKALLNEFHRSHIQVQPSSLAPTTLLGSIEQIEWKPSSIATGAPNSSHPRTAPFLPPGTLLTIQYHTRARVKVQLRRNSDGAILWEQTFAGEEVYPAPQVGIEIINTSNALYNYSAKNIALQKIAKNLMSEARKQILEDF